jgi:hypothetical protein
MLDNKVSGGPEANKYTKFFLTSLAAGSVLLLLNRTFSYKYYALTDFVNPEAVAPIAETFPEDNSSFIRAAWQFVADEVQYDRIPSDISLQKEQARCSRCYTPEEVLTRGYGNCLASSCLLASLLRNKFPPEQVMVVLGEISLDGVGGHAWVEAKNMGTWYNMESTVAPRDEGLLPVAIASEVYHPKAKFNDVGIYCMEEGFCKVNIRPKSCRNELLCYFYSRS